MSESKAGHDFSAGELYQFCQRPGCQVSRLRPAYDSSVWLWSDSRAKPARHRIKCEKRPETATPR